MGVELELELDLLAGLYCNNTVKKGWKSNDTRRNFVHRPQWEEGKRAHSMELAAAVTVACCLPAAAAAIRFLARFCNVRRSVVLRSSSALQYLQQRGSSLLLLCWSPARGSADVGGIADCHFRRPVD